MFAVTVSFDEEDDARAFVARCDEDRQFVRDSGIRSASFNDGIVRDEWERWQQGGCLNYAVALMRIRPTLRFASAGVREDDGWMVSHHFAHDDQYAYDSAGRHPLPYNGLNGDLTYVELDGDPSDWDATDEVEIQAAIHHAVRHNILHIERES